MISRVWHGWTTLDNAAAYEALLKEEIFVGIAEREIAGYRGIHLFRRELKDEVEFVTVMWFDSLEAVRAFAGAKYEVAVVPPKARALLSRFDARSQHYQVRTEAKAAPMKPQTPDDIFALLDIYVTSAALGAAMEWGLFWLLAEQPLDAAAVAQKLGIPTSRCRYWLELLHNVDLVEKTPAGYVPSPIAQSAILDAFSQDTWAFLAGESRDRFPAVRDLTTYIGEPGSTWAAQGLTPPDYFAAMVQSPDRARRFTRMLYEIHLPLADELAKSLDLHGVKRLLDLGGGSGVNAMALLRRNPQLSAVVVDIPNVCAAGREIAVENALEERITYHAADFLHEEIPSGFDMVLACDVGINNQTLLRKLRAALNHGGRLVIVNQFAPAAGEIPRSWLNWAFLASLENLQFSLSTTDNLKSNLAQAGFQVLSERLLPHGDVRRWSSDWTVIEAK